MYLCIYDPVLLCSKLSTTVGWGGWEGGGGGGGHSALRGDSLPLGRVSPGNALP